MKRSKKVMTLTLATAMVCGATSMAFAYNGMDGIQIDNKFYSIDYIVGEHAEAFSDIFGPANTENVIIDMNGKSAKFSDYLATNPADFDTWASNPDVQTPANATTIVKGDGTEIPVETPEQELKVESVKAINAKEIEIKFNKEIDEDTVVAVNFSINADSLADSGTYNSSNTSVALQDDKKTVKITMTNSSVYLTEGAAYAVEVSKNIADAEGNKLGTDYTETILFSDKTAPELASVTAAAQEGKTTTSIKVKFTEPVSATGALIKVNGVTATVTSGNETDELTLTTTDLTAGQTYELYIANLEDVNGNKISPNPLSFNFIVESDAAAPTVSSVEALNDKQVKVTFSEAVDTSSVTTSTVKVKKGDTILSRTVSWNTDNTEMTLTLTTNPFTGVTGDTVDVSVVINGVKDDNNNAMTETSNTVTLTKDTTAPSLVEAKVDQTTNKIQLVFDEEVAELTGYSDITITDQDGVEVARLTEGAAGDVTIVADADGKNTIVVLDFVTSANKTYTINVPKEVVKDLAWEANKNIAFSTTVTVGDTTDTTKPELATVTNEITSATGTNTSTINTNPVIGDVGYRNELYVMFNEEMTGGTDATSAINPSNYLLDGEPLPDGTTLAFVNSEKKLVRITFPDGTFIKDETRALTIQNVADKAGNIIDTVVKSFNAYDNVAPVLTSGKLVTAGQSGSQPFQIKLIFDEAMDSSALANIANDIVIKENGTVVNLNGSLSASLDIEDTTNKTVVISSDNNNDVLNPNTTLTVETAGGTIDGLKDASEDKNAAKKEVTVTLGDGVAPANLTITKFAGVDHTDFDDFDKLYIQDGIEIKGAYTDSDVATIVAKWDDETDVTDPVEVAAIIDADNKTYIIPAADLSTLADGDKLTLKVTTIDTNGNKNEQDFIVIAGSENNNEIGENVTLDRTAPTVASASVNNTTLTITFNEILSGSSANKEAFSITSTGNSNEDIGVSSVSVSGDTVTLILDKSPTTGNTVTVSYIANGTTDLTDKAGNKVANFITQVVNNN
ncbi:Ig-like domain-containing protein [Tepidibacter thalassicus]|uniref:Ig-like domain-containing protein n=1 Tax=Tepidibacter thalassicus DSM 15285 TaxID=1123350 RepID=A0A1M5S4W4_9FIRM|nr:Ig-like domain-containing protein [Tepidibacter thalassicus]SHH33526.1 Ig-like domain-containing protein [Tepidibacter thalassicus DSM 15285]